MLLFFIAMLFTGLLAAEERVPSNNNLKSNAQELNTPRYGYGLNGKLFIEQPPIIEEVRVRVVEKIPVIQKVIKVVRPVIEKVYVPVKVTERVPGEPIEAPEQDKAGGAEKGDKKEDEKQPEANAGDGQLLQTNK